MTSDVNKQVVTQIIHRKDYDRYEETIPKKIL
jgi:hypothetical protein